MLKRFGVPLTRVLSIRSLAGRSEERKPFTRVLSVRSLNSGGNGESEEPNNNGGSQKSDRSFAGRSEERKPFTRVLSVRSLNSGGNGESEEPNSNGGSSDPSWAFSLQHHLDSLLNECKEWEDNRGRAKQKVITQYEELRVWAEIPSLERYVEFLKEDTLYWRDTGDYLDAEKSGYEQRTRLVRAECQSVSHWKQQAEFWVGWARSLGVETGKGTDADLDFNISKISRDVKDIMKKVLVWSEDNHRAFIDDISYEIRKTQKEALVHWYHEITKWDSYSDNYKSALEARPGTIYFVEYEPGCNFA
ncbi:hypothetical protein HID58_067916 [Brassica napus]|uniref:(rape) hypothetical protein n=1 Tax=Brassica napus TaxID=3708 RepID=A0A816L9B3_BRANA|nr:hypothetical protein HID58_067916 [Brassica napus]CAF1933484.1 unnamed protein product [Brassica napus]